MHADAMAARPGILYFGAPTWWAIGEVRRLRAAGVPVMFTVDAGPHLVAFAPPEHLDRIAAALAAHSEIAEVIVSPAGRGAELIAALPEAPR
jgi:mevalonate pyrophosphate decarboxylase